MIRIRAGATHPKQFLEPLENAIRYFSSLGFSIHLSGRNFLGSGKKSGWEWICVEVIDMGVPAGKV